MALAAVEALRADGRAGKVPVTGIDGIQLAVEAILKGEMAGTVAWDPFWQGGMGLSIGYHAKTGTFDPSKEPKDHREFYGKGVIITARQRPVVLRQQHQGGAEARLERHLGPRQRADPVQLASAGRGRALRRARPRRTTARRSAPHGTRRSRIASNESPKGRAALSAFPTDPRAGDRLRRPAPRRRWRLAVVGAGHRAGPALR